MVGPNGSGKSNVVDALAWVMGEQGAKTLRGGKMEDVIFAGTATRGPLGRAQVTLTIDNADGLLPIEYAEVTISRTLFRNGGSEYAINGENCRLLDVQELLSDTGLGREMHVIVGQGQLDKVLHATPRGPTRLHRGSRGHPQAPSPQGEDAPQAGGDADQPHPAVRPRGGRSVASSSRSVVRPRWPARRSPSRRSHGMPRRGSSRTTWCASAANSVTTWRSRPVGSPSAASCRSGSTRSGSASSRWRRAWSATTWTAPGPWCTGSRASRSASAACRCWPTSA
ncbi:AAA family ATPase [Curtobacterium sp. MCPF17_052]|uniref:AAA family ATPase n=1 Tax=Curtobacterium sp. MCPF17_052 TaxID=2175655 RepID=UPI0024DFCFC3|nr:AAA family ATPase [Curtobacterium sp. MCPF17_052]WIB13833.1 hypothetical protein DEJ36_02605 [Curtobacterium sp. MCPF17_052]